MNPQKWTKMIERERRSVNDHLSALENGRRRRTNDAVFAARRPNESVDDVIEAVLDLLLPQGFQAKDLRVILPWIEATKLMVGTVTL